MLQKTIFNDVEQERSGSLILTDRIDPGSIRVFHIDRTDVGIIVPITMSGVVELQEHATVRLSSEWSTDKTFVVGWIHRSGIHQSGWVEEVVDHLVTQNTEPTLTDIGMGDQCASIHSSEGSVGAKGINHDNLLMCIEVQFRHSMTCYSKRKKNVDQERTALLIYGSQVVSEPLSASLLTSHHRLDPVDQLTHVCRWDLLVTPIHQPICSLTLVVRYVERELNYSLIHPSLHREVIECLSIPPCDETFLNTISSWDIHVG